MLESDTFDMNLSLSIIKNGNVMRLSSWFITKQIPHNVIVDLNVADPNSVLLILMSANLLEQLIDGSRNDTTILEVSVGTIHWEGLTSTGLAIAHDGTVVTIGDFGYNILGAILIDIFLGGVMLNFIKFECPNLLLIVDEASMFILRDVDSHMLND